MKSQRLSLITAFLILFAVLAWLLRVDWGLFGNFYLRYISLLFATLGLTFILLQFVLVSRVKILEDGFGLDRMFRWHRVFGRIGLILVLLHAVLIIIFRLEQYGEILFELFLLVGIAALLGFIITAGVASTYKKIGLAYETWRNIHLANYLLFPVAMVHALYQASPGTLLYYFLLLLSVLFLAVVVYRAARIFSIRRNPYEVVEVRQEAEDIWSLFFKGPRLDFKPGQFMFVQLLRNGELSSSHPFTISASPTAEYLSITPKKLGDFTMTIKDTKVGDRAFIDAPYGVFSFLNYGRGEPVFIAGGIGITPFMSMLRYMSDQNLDKKVTLFWANRSEENLCFRDELDKMEEKMPGLQVIPVMSNQPDWQGEKGHIKGHLILNYIETTENKEFYICGPPAMSRAVINELKHLDVSPLNIHSELFEL